MHADLSTLRFTLVMSGAVALGSYEAGVAAQLGYALSRYNLDQPDRPPLAAVDVIAGASAGALTGACLASHIMEGGDPDEWLERCVQSWCTRETDLRNIISPQPGDVHAFASSAKLDSQSRKHFRTPKPSPERVRQSELVLATTITSLYPIPYEYQGTTHDGHTVRWSYATHRDHGYFSIAHDDVYELQPKRTRTQLGCSQLSSWERILNFALASSAFPAVWQPMALHRPGRFFAPPWNRLDHNAQLAYVDGGLMNNTPLDLASDALHCLSGRHRQEKRIYLVIQPDPPNPDMNPQRVSDPDGTRCQDIPALAVLGRMIGALWDQNFYGDLFGAQKVNQRLNARNRFIPQLMRRFVLSIGDEELQIELESARHDLTDILLRQSSRHDPDALVARYREEYRTGERDASHVVGLDEARRRLYLLRLVLMDRIANLDDKHTMYVERICPEEPHQLAGRQLEHFAGFLHYSMRAHDYAIGVENCYTYLSQLARRHDWPEPARAPVKKPEKREIPEAELRDMFFGTVWHRGLDLLLEEVPLSPFLRRLVQAGAPWMLKRSFRSRGDEFASGVL